MPSRSARRALVACLTLLVGALGIAGVPRAEAQAAPWRVVTLRPLTAGQQTVVTDVNDAGLAVGTSGVAPVLWAPDGTPTALPTESGVPIARPTAINRHGIIVGSSGWPAPVPGRDAVAWVYGTVVPIVDNADALDISDANVVAGCIGGTTSEGRRPFVAHVTGQPILLPTDPASPAGCAQSLTAWGAVAGHQRTTPASGAPTRSGVLWFNGQAIKYTGTPHHVTEVRRVAESGYVLLMIAPTSAPTQPSHAAIGAPGGQYYVLDPLSAGSSAADLNDAGIAVGNRLTQGNGSGSEPFAEPVLWVYGSTVPLASLVAGADIAKVASGIPAALSDTNIVAGNTGNASWLLRPP